MSPLVSSPNRGYADYQRTVNYDTDLLFQYSGAGDALTHTSPTIDVSRFAYLCGSATQATNVSLMTFNWSTEFSPFVPDVVNEFTVTPLIFNPMQFRVPALAAFVQVVISPIAALTYQNNYTVWASNRITPYQFVPSGQTVIDQQNSAIGAGATVTLYPTDYWAGPTTVWWISPPANGFLGFQSVSQSNTWDQFWGVSTTNAGAYFQFQVTMPAGAWRAQVVTTGAAGTYYLAVVPSLTGST